MAEHQDPTLGDCDAARGPCPSAEVGCPATTVLPQGLPQDMPPDPLLGLSLDPPQGLPQDPLLGLSQSLPQGLPQEDPPLGLPQEDPPLGLRQEDPSLGLPQEDPPLGLPQDHKDELLQEYTALYNSLQNLPRLALRPSVPSVEPWPIRSNGGPVTVPTSLGMVDASPEQEVQRLPQQLQAANETIRRLENLENRIANQDVRICDESHHTNGGGPLVENLVRELEMSRETIRRLERRVEATENALADLQEQEMSSYDGVLLWKIDDFSKRKNDAISGRQPSFYSPCFYTSRHGYKMCARIYLNGDGMGENTHMAVSFVIMRGKFDALLRWPFQQKVTITLLDQDHVEHVTRAFGLKPNSSSFQRPRRDLNVESVCPLFCFLAELNNHGYIRDDVMFMKIIVDTSGLQ